MSSILRSSKFVRYFVGLARNIVISNRQDVDGSLLQRSQNLAGLFSSNFSSSPSHLQAGSSLERTVRRLDEDARRIGRLSIKEIEEALNEIRHSKQATTSQSLMVIRCCGNLVPEESPEQRTKLVEEIWNTLEKLGVSLDISHYNALLKVYLENEHKFSPAEFLAKLEKKGVEPNRVTYQRLISGYCQMGDIAGATKILEFMKEKQLPVSEGVFNALILGHSQADDMESAEGMLGVMRQANLEPSNETYTTLLCGYARRGDKEALDRLITECKVKDVLLSDKDFLDVVYTAATSGHDQLVDEILKNIRHMMSYNQDAANIILRLITKGKDEAAYKVFLTMRTPVRSEGTPNMSGHVLIKQLIKTNRSVQDILSMCERLEKDGHTNFGLWMAVENSFHHGNIDLTLGLLKALKEKNEPVRNHYFWPSLVTASKTGNINHLTDILKKMVNEFEIFPSSDTLKDYYLPYAGSKSPEDNLKALVEAGVPKRSSVVAIISYFVSENKLKEAVDIALQYPVLNITSMFMNRLLVDALQQTGDVESVVSLVHIMASKRTLDREEDEEGVEAEQVPSRFLQSLAPYNQTRQYIPLVLKEMVKYGLSISNSCAEFVGNRLQGSELTAEVSDLLAQLCSGDLSPTALRRTRTPQGFSFVKNPAVLERIKEKIKANNEPKEKLMNIVRSIFMSHCANGDLEGALKAKQEWVEELKEELTPGWWASLLDVYCDKGDLEGAKQCLESFKACSTEFEMDLTKALKLVKLYIQNNLMDEAISIIKEVIPRNGSGYQIKAGCWQALVAVADTTKDPEQVKKLFQALLERQFIEVSNVFLGPIIKAYLLRDDLEGALKEFGNCVKMYRATPWKHEIATRLIEKEDPVNLQTLVDLSTQVHGEINSLYDLVLSFVECGRIRQARKILETPGLTRNNRLYSACERYKNEGQVAPLEGLVEATKDLPHIDRSEIYYSLLETYCEADNVDKAYGLWTQMQDEDVHVPDEFLIKLGGLLKSKGLQVPFQIPKSREQVEPGKQRAVASGRIESQKQRASVMPVSSPFSAAIKAKALDEALKIKGQLESSGEQLTRKQLTGLMELMIENRRLKDATDLLTSLPPDNLPAFHCLDYFINRLALAGEVDLLKRVGDHLTLDLKKATSYINRLMAAAVSAGKAKDELDKIEKQIDSAATPEEVDTLADEYPRGGINSVLESSPTYHEQVARITEKFFNKGVSAPANCLCMFYLADGQTDKAKELFQRYNIANVSRIMFQSVLGRARTTNNPQLVEELISLLKGVPSITPEIEGLMHSSLINVYVKRGDDQTALVKLEEAMKTVSLENIHRNTLTNLKQNLEAKNIPFPYTIPPKKIKEQSSTSSSSSSSDEEPKKSVAAKH